MASIMFAKNRADVLHTHPNKYIRFSSNVSVVVERRFTRKHQPISRTTTTFSSSSINENTFFEWCFCCFQNISQNMYVTSQVRSGCRLLKIQHHINTHSHPQITRCICSCTHTALHMRPDVLHVAASWLAINDWLNVAVVVYVGVVVLANTQQISQTKRSVPHDKHRCIVSQTSAFVWCLVFFDDVAQQWTHCYVAVACLAKRTMQLFCIVFGRIQKKYTKNGIENVIEKCNIDIVIMK